MQDSEEDSAQEDIVPKSKRTKKAYKQKYNRVLFVRYMYNSISSI